MSITISTINKEPTAKDGYFYFDDLEGCIVKDFDDYFNTDNENIKFIPLEHQDMIDGFIVRSWEQYYHIKYESLDESQRQAIKKYFEQLEEKGLDLPVRIAIGKNKDNDKEIVIFGTNVVRKDTPTSENDKGKFFDSLELKNTKKPRWIFAILSIVVLSVILLNIDDIKKFIKNFQGSPVKEVLTDEKIAQNFESGDNPRSFYAYNFPKLYKALSHNEDPLHDVAEQLLDVNYIDSLWNHYQKSFWKNGNSNNKISTISRNILYDYFNSNAFVKKVIENNQDLLTNTDFINKFYVYGKEHLPHKIYYWSNTDFRVSKKEFDQLLINYNVVDGWEFEKRNNKEQKELNQAKIPNKSLLVYDSIDNSKQLMVVMDIEGVVSSSEVAFFESVNPTIIYKDLFDKIISRDRKLKWYEVDKSFHFGDVKYLASSNQLDRMKIGKIKEFINEGRYFQLYKDDYETDISSSPLLEDTIVSPDTTNGIVGFKSNDPVVATVLYNLISEKTIFKDMSEFKRDSITSNESDIYLTERKGSSNRFWEFEPLDENIIVYLNNVSEFTVIPSQLDKQPLVFYNVTKDKWFKPTVYSVYNRKVLIKGECTNGELSIGMKDNSSKSYMMMLEQRKGKYICDIKERKNVL